MYLSTDTLMSETQNIQTSPVNIIPLDTWGFQEANPIFCQQITSLALLNPNNKISIHEFLNSINLLAKPTIWQSVCDAWQHSIYLIQPPVKQQIPDHMIAYFKRYTICLLCNQSSSYGTYQEIRENEIALVARQKYPQLYYSLLNDIDNSGRLLRDMVDDVWNEFEAKFIQAVSIQ